MCGLWSRSWRRSTWWCSHTRFVVGVGQDFADLVDELLSGTSQGSYDAVAEACILQDLSKPTALPMTSPARACVLTSQICTLLDDTR
jgi:hypothetical protein